MCAGTSDVCETIPQRSGLPILERSCESILTSKMTTEQDSTFEDPNETTPVEVSDQTTGSTVTSSSSRGATFYVQCAVLVIAIVGAAANALVLYALIACKQHKKHMLIFNQNVHDFVNCMFLVLAYSIKLSGIYLSGTLGYWLCVTLLSGAGSWGAYVGSLINLSAISIERYLKIVHHAWAKTKLRDWMIYSAIAFAWIGGIVCGAGLMIPTSGVVNGVCYEQSFWKSQTARVSFGIYNFLSFYVIILLIFIFCYGRILMAVRRQARVMAAHSAGGSNTAQDQSNKIQTNVIKTMIFVCVLYIVTLAPVHIYSLLLNFNKVKITQEGAFIVLFIGYIYICINPFIYATKFDPVKRVLLGMIPCKKNTQPLESSVNT